MRPLKYLGFETRAKKIGKIMFKAIVVIGSLAASNTGQLEDTKGPYNTAPECYYRTAQMIKETATRIPIVYAVGICIKIPVTKKGVDT